MLCRLPNRAQKKGSEVTVAAREKITDLQEHASNVETLLNSMQASNFNECPLYSTPGKHIRLSPVGSIYRRAHAISATGYVPSSFRRKGLWLTRTAYQHGIVLSTRESEALYGVKLVNKVQRFRT